MTLLPCVIHGVDEDDTGAHRTCAECWHVWKTEAELLADHNRVMREVAACCGIPQPLGDLRPGEGVLIRICPLCAHDL